MSDKKTTKTEEELVEDLKAKKVEDFKERLKMLEDEFNYRLEPILHFSQQGVMPTINVVEVPEKKAEKGGSSKA